MIGELGSGSSAPAAKVIAPKVAPMVVPRVAISSFLARPGPVKACVCLEVDGALSSNCANSKRPLISMPTPPSPPLSPPPLPLAMQSERSHTCLWVADGVAAHRPSPDAIFLPASPSTERLKRAAARLYLALAARCNLAQKISFVTVSLREVGTGGEGGEGSRPPRRCTRVAAGDEARVRRPCSRTSCGGRRLCAAARLLCASSTNRPLPGSTAAQE